MKKTISKSEQATFDLAKKLAASLGGGTVIGLIGELGTGKTIFAKGLAEGFGIKTVINSPTFVLMKIYDIDRGNIKKLCHIDAYRIKTFNEIKTIGAEEYMKRPDTITIIEWADRIKNKLPKNTYFINFKHQEENNRLIQYE
ncbi:tRNA (adenosine(37)-N6)-threonylcarbamoyltransferase complex ATPase subunit type 1 TsaE [bacterium]|nr:tRNA (adenosine(37)-N6)-threonylcarbamoyltransferase complex ATPase subunit type 1 TsaE [bacterium]